MKKKMYWLRICGEFPAKDEGRFFSLANAKKAAEKASNIANVAFVYVMTTDPWGDVFIETARQGKINTYPNSQF